MDDIPLSEQFPELYRLSVLKNVSMVAMSGWKDNGWCWGDLGLHGSVEEEPVLLVQFSKLRGLLENFEGWKEGKDSVVWLGKCRA